MIDILQFFALVCGLAGAVFVAGSQKHWRFTGFSIWVFGNAAWAMYGVLNENPYLTAQFGFFLLTSVAGIRSNWIAGKGAEE